MNEIYLIRHAETEPNKSHIIGVDEPLSFRGKCKIITARTRYRDIMFDKIYSSQLIQTQQTATLLLHGPVSEERRLNAFDEIYFEDTEDEMTAKRHEYLHNTVSFIKNHGGDDVYDRADTAISKLKVLAEKMTEFSSAYPNKRIAILTHGILMQSIILTLRSGHEWEGVSDLPQIDSLDHIRLLCSRDSINSAIFNGVVLYSEDANLSYAET